MFRQSLLSCAGKCQKKKKAKDLAGNLSTSQSWLQGRKDNLQSRTVLHVIAPFDAVGWRHRSCFGRAAEGSSAGQRGGP